LGAVMLTVMLVRLMKGHFTADNHFGFEAALGTGTLSMWSGLGSIFCYWF